MKIYIFYLETGTSRLRDFKMRNPLKTVSHGFGLLWEAFLLLVPVSPPVHFEWVKIIIFSGRAISEQHFSERAGLCEQHTFTA